MLRNLFLYLTACLTISSPAYALTGTLTAEDPASAINIRHAPTTEAEAHHSGRSGNQVTILTATPGEGNYTWYYIRFDQTGVEGWIRQDLMTVPRGTVPLGQIQAGNYGIGPTGVGMQLTHPRFHYYDEMGSSSWQEIIGNLYYVTEGTVFDGTDYWCLLDQYPTQGIGFCTPQGWQSPD